PAPPEKRGAKNPPDGAIIYSRLASAARTPVVLDILDPAGRVVRSFSSADSVDAVLPSFNAPTYWLRPHQRLATAAGTHRFVWDLHYPPPKVLAHEYPISAIFGDTPRH